MQLRTAAAQSKVALINAHLRVKVRAPHAHAHGIRTRVLIEIIIEDRSAFVVRDLHMLNFM